MTEMRSGGGTTCRHRTGAISYWAPQEEREIAVDASELYLTGEIWGNSFYALNTWTKSTVVDFPFISTGFLEEIFLDTFSAFVELARNHVRLELPVRLNMGLVGVLNYRLAVDPQYFYYENYKGRMLDDVVRYETILSDWTTEPFDALSPFFFEIYDKAGVIRPNVRTAGRRSA